MTFELAIFYQPNLYFFVIFHFKHLYNFISSKVLDLSCFLNVGRRFFWCYYPPIDIL